ncbi:hypothetical protein AGIG_G4573 [Arapaima gigas]
MADGLREFVLGSKQSCRRSREGKSLGRCLQKRVSNNRQNFYHNLRVETRGLRVVREVCTSAEMLRCGPRVSPANR